MSFPTFEQFFGELNRMAEGEPMKPFPWQIDLANRAVAGNWPEFITAPTGSGKSASLEIAVYALAAQAHLPPSERRASRRIFFIVNRRVVVDQAFEKACRIADILADPGSGRPACSEVAEALLTLAPLPENGLRFPRRPLESVQLRGAIFRDQRWARSLLQPMIIATTIDQIGSRLLFRGYGVTANARPIHAALVATDALWILDEAHISRPFADSVALIQRYREHHLAQNPKAVRPPPVQWVQMTATPPKDAMNTIGLTAADRKNRILSRRLSASKPANLVVSKPKTKSEQQETLITDLVNEAVALVEEFRPGSLAVIVNRVVTARRVAGILRKEMDSVKPRISGEVRLVIGRMRPIDRDEQNEQIKAVLKTAARRELLSEDESDRHVEIVVATQCLEVGADFDFDALVTECASLDALRQRFGRLNRMGRDISSRAVILMPKSLIEPDEKKLEKLTAEGKFLDPIYSNALSATWNWLTSVATDEVVDFGLAAMEILLKGKRRDDLQVTPPSGPIIFPAYLDAWAQTNPTPWPDPEPALFLHGTQSSRPDVLIVWRADFSPSATLESACHDLSLCPPSQAEALPVPLQVFRDWLFRNEIKNPLEADIGDLFEAAGSFAESPAGNKKRPIGRALLWQGMKESRFIEEPGDLFPGATIVLPVRLGGWNELGYIPEAPPDPMEMKEGEDPVSISELLKVDRAEEAFFIARGRAVLRLRSDFYSEVKGEEAWQQLLEYAGDSETNLNANQIRILFEKASNDNILYKSLDNISFDLKTNLTLFADRATGFIEDRYFDETAGIVFTTRRRLSGFSIEQIEDEEDGWSRSLSSKPVTLDAHLQHVAELVAVTVRALNLEEGLANALVVAAKFHDLGKLDHRFQAFLLEGNRHAAYALAEPLAKSDRGRMGIREWKAAQKGAGMPVGFRHEFASFQLAELSDAVGELPMESEIRDLVLHLIASHHGYARPFAPVVDDFEPPSISTANLSGVPDLILEADLRKENPAHRLDSGVSDRFWRLLRLHGPWGLAYLETLLRLADQQASEAEAEEWYLDDKSVQPVGSHG